MIGEIRQNFTEASASVGLILATALLQFKLFPECLLEVILYLYLDILFNQPWHLAYQFNDAV